MEPHTCPSLETSLKTHYCDFASLSLEGFRSRPRRLQVSVTAYCLETFNIPKKWLSKTSVIQRERESLLAQTLNNFVQIKAKGLGHRKKTVNRLCRRAPLDSFINSYLGSRVMAELLRI